MNKTALVTGVSKGIGNAIARRLAEDGMDIVGTYNTSEKEALELKNKIRSIELYKVNFSNREETLNLVGKLSDKKFDVIVNNAGIIIFEKFADLSLGNWDKVLEVNLTTPLIITHGLQHAINQDGVVINICSTDGLTGSFASLSYSASKAGLINLTKSLGNVLGNKGVRVVGVAPGWVGSGMDSPAMGEAKANNPTGRNASYEEIAGVVAMLISDDARFINGTTIVVDGGYVNVDSILKKEAEAL